MEQRLIHCLLQDIELRLKCSLGYIVFAITVLVALTSLATADSVAIMSGQDEESPSEITKSQDSTHELQELGETLKAAVLSGTLTEEDAIAIYNNMLRSLAPKNEKKKESSVKNNGGRYASKQDIVKLSAPRPSQIIALLQPEFLRRDLQRLRIVLDLDRDQMAIIEILFQDYTEAFELASTPFREGLSLYWHSSADQWVAAALDRANIDEVDVAVAKTKDSLKQYEIALNEKDDSGELSGKREAREAWAERMVVVTATMQDRMEELRERVKTNLAELQSAGSIVTVDDLVLLAHKLRSERTQLRMDFTESLGLVCLIKQTEPTVKRFNTAIARARIEHDLKQGRLGGESMNLWAALTETARARESGRGRAIDLGVALTNLNERASVLAARLNERRSATIDREICGLEFLAARNSANAKAGLRESGARIDSSRLNSALRPFAKASKHELIASVAVRDELLAMLDETSDLLDEVYPESDLSLMYRDSALQRGFSSELRQRWSERAIKAALKRNDLNKDSRAVLEDTENNIALSILALHKEAINKRIDRDPKRAQELIDAQFKTKSEANNSTRKNIDSQAYLGYNHHEYTILDEQIEEQLLAILTAEQFASLPERWNAAKGGKGKMGKKGKP